MMVKRGNCDISLQIKTVYSRLYKYTDLCYVSVEILLDFVVQKSAYIQVRFLHVHLCTFNDDVTFREKELERQLSDLKMENEVMQRRLSKKIYVSCDHSNGIHKGFMSY